MNRLMQELKRDAVAGMKLPALRFFTARPRFFDILMTFDANWVEAGCGNGHTTREARDRGLGMVGVDICEREGQLPEVVIADAILMPYLPTIWPLICRPNHDGWPEDVIEAAFKRGSAGAVYVGFEKNLETDLGEYADRHSQAWEEVGMEGESMWLLRPGS